MALALEMYRNGLGQICAALPSGIFRGTEKSEKGVKKEIGKVNFYQGILKEYLLYYQILFARLLLYQLANSMGVGMSSPDVKTVVHLPE